MIIKFKINPWRKNVNNKFNARLSDYWNQQLNDVFRKW